MRKMISLALAAGLVASACAGSDPTVAEVNGQAILLSDVEDLSGGAASAPEGEFTQNLGFLIVIGIISGAAQDQFGIAVDPDAVQAEVDQFISTLDTTDRTVDDALAEQNLNQARLRAQAELFVLSGDLSERLATDAGAVSESEIEQGYRAYLTANANVCTRHILVPTLEEAEAARQRIDQGEEFGDVAAEVGQDGTAQENGELGCSPPSQYVGPFADATLDAPVGELFGPVQTEFGYHLIIVDSREAPALDEIRDTVVAQVEANRGTTLLNDWALAELQAAEVVVEAEYGTWDPVAIQVVPPEG